VAIAWRTGGVRMHERLRGDEDRQYDQQLTPATHRAHNHNPKPSGHGCIPGWGPEQARFLIYLLSEPDSAIMPAGSH